MPRRGISIRDATENDMPRIADIYGHFVQTGLATFEESSPSSDEMLARRVGVLKLGFPYLVAECEGEVVGYTYASTYRPRPAYRFAVENSVYVADGHHGCGIGGALLGELIERCEKGPWRQMLAVIGNSGNFASIELHRRFGFVHVGTLQSVGFKLDRWVDTVLMQRALGSGDMTRPVRAD